MKKNNNILQHAKEMNENIKKGYIKQLLEKLLNNEGPVDSVKLREFLDAAGLNEIANEYKKVLPVLLLKVETALEKNIPIGTVDGINLKTREDIMKYVKNNNPDGWVILQTQKDGTIDFYAPGKEVLEKDYEEIINDSEKEKYMKKINPELKKYLKEKNIDINELPLISKKNKVLMLKIKDIQEKFPDLANKLLKDGIIIKDWGNYKQEVKEKNYIVFDGDNNTYTIEADIDGNPTGYEPVDDSPNADGGYKPEM